MEKVKWKVGTQFKVDAQVACDTISKLQNALGKETITAKDLLDASRDENAPLHNCFEWDDSIAAEQYRIWQARSIINSIEIVITKSEKPVTVRRYINVNSTGSRKQGDFAPVETVLKNPILREQILSNALIELRAFQRKYNAYEELTGVFSAIASFAGNVNK